jgi:hypothetical protein
VANQGALINGNAYGGKPKCSPQVDYVRYEKALSRFRGHGGHGFFRRRGRLLRCRLLHRLGVGQRHAFLIEGGFQQLDGGTAGGLLVGESGGFDPHAHHQVDSAVAGL